jgi:hypothetical protein
MKRWLIVLFGISALCACASATRGSQVSDKAPLPTISVDTFTAVLVPANPNFEGTWTPTESQVFQAEPKIQQCILAKRHDLRRILARYVRQYAGHTVEGRKVLGVGFYDSRSFPMKQLRQTFVIVDYRGGDQFFTVEYDIESEQCSLHFY